jgi:peptide-methionine (R)-S-oxide reductase
MNSRKNKYSVMSRLILLLILTPFLLISCQNKKDPRKGDPKVMTESQHPKNPYYSRTDTTTLNLPDSVWKKVLPDDVYQIARNKATETAYTGKYWDHTGIGTYYCAACGNPLFRSDAWFASSCGWPSFFEPIRKNSVIYKPDNSYGMQRTEVLCGRCGAHLGHIFDDGPPPTGKRFCMNSIVLDFVPDSVKAEK